MKKRISIIISILVLITTVCIAQESKILTPEDQFREVSVGSPEVSPDGKWILYSIRRPIDEKGKTESDLYLLPFEGGAPRRLTATPGGEGDYTWNPDSTRIAFSAEREGEEEQIYVIDIRGGEAVRLTDMPNGAYGPQWSPDGSMLAFYSRFGDIYTPEEREAYGDVRYIKHLRYHHLGPGWDKGKRQRIFVMPAEGGEARQLTAGECADEGDHSMTWSPDSQEIAYVSNRAEEWWNTIDTNIYIVNVDSGKSRQVTDNVGPDHSPTFSPDGKWLAWRAILEYNYESENYKIHLMPYAGGDAVNISNALDRSVRSITWSTNSDKIFFTSSSEGKMNIQYVEIDKPDKFHDVTSGQNLIYNFEVVDDNRFVIRKVDDTAPAEIFTLVNGEFNKLTHDASEFWEDYEVSPCEEIWIDTVDGRKAQGWLVKPLGYEEGRKYPTILRIHGGPHGMYRPALNFEYQLWAHNGYAVLFTNPRGSDGYGQAFADAIHENWGETTWSDLERFVDKAIDMGVADQDKLGVIGGSFGGYMTKWIVGQTDRFKAAIPIAGLSNIVSFFGSTDEQFFIEKEMGGLPWWNQEAYMKNSPLWYADNFKTPTMIIHGENDWRVRPEQAEQFYTALQKMGVPSVLVRHPNEQHGTRKAAGRLLNTKLILEWFDHWLKGKPVKLAKYITPKKYQHPLKPYESPKH